MIDHWKPLGGFIENTIRPLIGELHWFFEECDKRGIALSEHRINMVMNYIANRWLCGLLIKLIQNIVIAVIIGFSVCKTFQ